MLGNFARGVSPGFGGCGVGSEQMITAVLRISFLRAQSSCHFGTSLVISLYPKPTGGTLLRHGEHEGLDCAFGFTRIACTAAGNTFGGSQA